MKRRIGKDKLINKGIVIQPPVKSKNLISDIRYFILNKPEINTLVHTHSTEEREEYDHRILQRTGIGTKAYKLLNIHKISVEAPVSHIFDELLKWNGDSSCWPNHIANVKLVDQNLESLHLYLFKPFKIKNKLFGYRLFNMKAARIRQTPAPCDQDNARYLLYKCSGGYPIGVFSIYVRSSIPELKEEGMSQLFFVVGFNFYGSRSLSKVGLINRTWEMVHNRVTANVANRFRQLCESRFQDVKDNYIA